MAQAPAQFGRYEVVRELSRGGMGVVYVAADTRLGRQVALKVLLDPQADRSLTARFEREARALAALRHPGIVAIHDQGTHDGRPFLAMELVEGESLEGRLRREGPLPPLEAARLVEEVARALEHAHGAGVLHRDLKPANVLVEADGRPKVVDFGLARTQDGALTSTGEVLGTATFMAPEQAAGERHEVGPATDVYGLGATLFALLTGAPPFDGSSFVNVLKSILVDPPPDPRRLRPEIPAELAAVCLRCLAKEPQQRYASAGELADALGQARTAAAAPAPASPRGGRAGLVVGGLGAIALAVAAAALAPGPGSQPPAPPPASPDAAASPPSPAQPDVVAPPPVASGQPDGPAPALRLRGTWKSLPSNLPSDRECALATAGALGVFVHGGRRPGAALLGDAATWADGAWAPRGEGAPGPRHGHALAYDPRGDRVLLSGGLGKDGRLADLWAWSCAEHTWERLDREGEVGPAGRAYHGIACDPKTGAVLLHGGQDRKNGPALGDLWQWTEADRWRKLADEPRSAQYVGGVVWDAAHGRLVVYGGKRGNGAGTELHEWNGARWEHFPLGGDGPGPRTRVGVVFDGRRTIVFGGRAPGDVLLADVWAWDGRWTPIELTTSEVPPARSDHGMAWDAARGRVVVFGGQEVEDGRVWELTLEGG